MPVIEIKTSVMGVLKLVHGEILIVILFAIATWLHLPW